MLNHAKELEREQPDNPQTPLHTEESEALFTISELRTLGLATHHHKASVSDFLAREVARNPAELRRHVQRISLFLTKDNGSRAYGAITDLFIALGENGLPLRRRMLEVAKPLLSADQYRALHDKLQSGLSPLERVPLSGESILGKGIRGTTRLVERVDTQGRSGPDILADAQSCLEYGQVDEARCLLEEAVLKEPSRWELHQELLEIYVHSRDYTHFSTMLQALQFSGDPVPPTWQRLAADLGLDAAGEEPASAERQGRQAG